MNADNQWSKQEACFAHATNGFDGVQNGKMEQPQPMEQTRSLFCTCNSDVARCQTPVSHLANEFDVRSKLHRQVSLAAVNQILCVS